MSAEDGADSAMDSTTGTSPTTMPKRLERPTGADVASCRGGSRRGRRLSPRITGNEARRAWAAPSSTDGRHAPSVLGGGCAGGRLDECRLDAHRHVDAAADAGGDDAVVLEDLHAACVPAPGAGFDRGSQHHVDAADAQAA